MLRRWEKDLEVVLKRTEVSNCLPRVSNRRQGDRDVSDGEGGCGVTMGTMRSADQGDFCFAAV